MFFCIFGFSQIWFENGKNRQESKTKTKSIEEKCRNKNKSKKKEGKSSFFATMCGFCPIWCTLIIFPTPEKGRSSSGGSSPCPRIRATVVFWWKFQWWSTWIHKNSCPSSRRLWDDFDDSQNDDSQNIVIILNQTLSTPEITPEISRNNVKWALRQH